MSSCWHQPLAFPISPKSGPVRRMETMMDANQALLHDLPPGYLKERPHWLKAANALVAAVDSRRGEIHKAAYEALVSALELEGWLTITPAEFAADLAAEARARAA